MLRNGVPLSYLRTVRISEMKWTGFYLHQKKLKSIDEGKWLSVG